MPRICVSQPIYAKLVSPDPWEYPHAKLIENIVSQLLAEDVGQEDLTTNATVPPDLRCRARLIAKDEGVLSGCFPSVVLF